MNKEKVSKKETKKAVYAKLEAALKGYKISNKDKKFIKIMKKASNSLADFIVSHKNAVTPKSIAIKAKTKKSTLKKVVKENPE